MNAFANLRNWGIGAALLAAVTCPASAASVMNFTFTDTSVNGYTAPFGTVTVTQLANGALGFDVDLAGLYTFHTNPNHNSFAFGLEGNETLTVTDLSSGFDYLGYGPYKEAGFTTGKKGNWDYAFNCTSCTGGSTGPTSLSFTITDTAHDLNLEDLVSSFSFNGDAIYMTADLRDSVGATGNVGATIAVPEPAAWGMLLFGFGLIGTTMRRRRNAAAVA